MSCVSKRKYRWSLEFYDKHTYECIIPRGIVRLQSKPTMIHDYSTVETLGGNTLTLPGRNHWADFSVTYPDADNNEGAYFLMSEAGRWFNDINTNYEKHMPLLDARLRSWSSNAELFEGDPPDKEWGWPLETWDLHDVFVVSLNFGDLSYGSSEEYSEVEVTMKYQSVGFSAEFVEEITVPALGVGVPKFSGEGFQQACLQTTHHYRRHPYRPQRRSF